MGKEMERKEEREKRGTEKNTGEVEKESEYTED